MKKTLICALALGGALLAGCVNITVLEAPKMTVGNLRLEPQVSDDHQLSFKLYYQTDTSSALVLSIPQVGLEFASGFGKGMKYKNSPTHYTSVMDYKMVGGKSRFVNVESAVRIYTLADSLGRELNVRVNLQKDGLAFCYEVKGLKNDTIREEKTVYHFAEGVNRWVQRWTEAYEGFFPLTTSGEGQNRHWGYPALFEPQAGLFALVSEAGIVRRQSASSLYNDQKADEYRVVPAENNVALNNDWHSPWRVVMVGELGDVVESTLVTDVVASYTFSNEETYDPASYYKWVKPGSVSWVYWAYNHGSNDYQIVKKYIDMAAKLGLPYVLIDAEWDEMKNGGDINDVLRYAKEKSVKPLVWYNSSTAWIKEWGAPGPHNRLNTPEDREKEFAWLEANGVAGVKIDFFAGDKQTTMDYCIELLECAAKHHLLVNFHGATTPRGWQFTYPNLVSTEGVYGAEWYNNVPTFTKMAARHNATLPFTRNVVGPMDYTPCAFSDSQHPHITTHAHELALSVLYESTLLHWADKPESYYAQPEAVQKFIGQVPTVWDVTKYVSGYPGESAVLARCKGVAWYVAGINGCDEAQTLELNWDFLRDKTYTVTTYADSGNPDMPWNIYTIEATPAQLQKTIDLLPRGGFIMVLR